MALLREMEDILPSIVSVVPGAIIHGSFWYRM